MRTVGGVLETVAGIDMPVCVVCGLVIGRISTGWWLTHVSSINIPIVLSVGVLLLGVPIAVWVMVLVCHGAL